MFYDYFFGKLFDDISKMFDKDLFSLRDKNIIYPEKEDDYSNTIEVEIDDEKPSDKKKSPIEDYFHEIYKEFINGEKVCEKEKEVINGDVTKHVCTKKEFPKETKGIDVDKVMKKYQDQLEINHKLTSELETLKKECDELKAAKCKKGKKNEDAELCKAQYAELSEEMKRLQQKMDDLKNNMEDK